MGTANNRENAQDTIIYDQSGTIDPSVVGYEAAPGTTYRMLVEGNAKFFVKQDEGFSTNWTEIGAGEISTASNVGTGSEVFKVKTGSDFKFRTLKQGANVTITQSSDELLISAAGPDGGEVNTASNVGAGTGLYKQKVAADLQFKTLKQGTNVTITSDDDEVTINASSSGEVNTGSNLGTGSGVYAQKVGSDLQFKSLKQGSNVSITSDANEITINATNTGEVNTASNVGTGSGLYKQKVGANLEFKSLKAGTNVTLTASGDEVTISSSSGASFSPAQTVFVAKNGSDVTGNGTQDNPFLTISAALTSITDASPSKRYAIQLSPGEYTEASIALKANVFIVGTGQKETTRITGAVSLHSSFSGSADNRSGFAQVILLSACDFNWNTVTSAAGKLYFNEVSFSSTINLYGYNNAIAQAQFNDCVIFGAMTISGINVGVYTNCFNFNNITLNQHPNGGMASILSMAGGYCSGTVNLVTTVNDFSRRCSLFARSFWMNALTINGASSYADVTYSSLPAAGPTILNGGNIVYLNPSATGANQQLSNLAFPTAVNQPIMPANTNATNFGDWGKQWFWSFGYVHASTGTDLYLISYGSAYGADSTGRNIGIYADGAGLQANVNGGDIELGTASVSGTGIRGRINLDGREVNVNSTKIVSLAAGTASTDAVNLSQLTALQNKTIAGQYSMPSGVSSFSVSGLSVGTTNYIVNVTIENLVDLTVRHLVATVTAKTATSFNFTTPQTTDTGNYKANYIITKL